MKCEGCGRRVIAGVRDGEVIIYCDCLAVKCYPTKHKNHPTEWR